MSSHFIVFFLIFSKNIIKVNRETKGQTFRMTTALICIVTESLTQIYKIVFEKQIG